MTTTVHKAQAPARLLTTKDMEAEYGIPIATQYQMRLRGEMPPAVKFGRKLYYRREDIEKWVASKLEAGR